MDIKQAMGSVRPLSLSESEELKPKLWAKKFPVDERKDINVGKLVRYTAARAEEESYRQSDENPTKHQLIEQLYGRYLVRLGATRAEKE